MKKSLISLVLLLVCSVTWAITYHTVKKVQDGGLLIEAVDDNGVVHAGAFHTLAQFEALLNRTTNPLTINDIEEDINMIEANIQTNGS
jgi:hypothetical protein